MRKLAVHEVVERIKKIHGDQISLNESTYIDTNHKARFIDKDCGEWCTTPNSILAGHKHIKRRRVKATISPPEIQKRIDKIHNGNITLDVTTYVNTKKKAKFIDKDYGEWLASPTNVMSGQGHPQRGYCALILASTIQERLDQIHGGIVTLDKSTYINTTIKARFIDKDYGPWWAPAGSVLLGRGHVLRSNDKRTLSINKVQKRIDKIHNGNITLDVTTYVNTKKKAKFIDKDYGEWWCKPNTILAGHGHKKRKIDKTKKTMLKRYGVEYASQDRNLALKQARSANNFIELIHWKTGEIIPCQASYEVAVVDYFNQNKIDFQWQIIFNIPKYIPIIGGKTYRVDCYLPVENKYIEIKGYMREMAKHKWEWFHAAYPNSELWDKPKLKELRILINSRKRK